MLSVSALGKAFGSQILFRNASFQLQPRCRYGLVGANGSGKTTLLRILAGDEPPSEGDVSVPKRLRLGLLEQDHFRYEEMPILEVAMMGDREAWAALQAKEALLGVHDDHFDGHRLAELEQEILHLDGYTLESRAGEILEGLGIPSEIHREPLSTLSGGFKLRVLLAKVLVSRPDLLLLDEPTNHLDILSIRWLETFLQTFPGCAVLISHDHRFLDNVCTHILDVDYETVTLYPGNYTAFTVAKRADRERKEAEIAKREREIAHHQAFVERFRAKATKARQAQSKAKLIERIVLEPLPQSSRRYPTFRFRQRRPSGRQVLSVEGISKAFEDNQVLQGVSFQLRREDRLAIIGANGVGKSTLLKLLMGILPADAGKVEWGYETYPGYFAQDHRELLGERDLTVESWLWEACPGEPIGFVRGRLGQVLFSGEEAQKKVRHLSGGEAARLIFCRLGVEEPNVLVLDEPTNHLDLEAIEALVEGLRDYDGTLVFVSHDRWFVSQLATRILEITPKGIQDFPGTYEEYIERCGDDHLDAQAVVLRARREKRRGTRSRIGNEGDRETLRRQKELSQRRDRLAEAMEKAEARIHAINEIFCDPTYFQRTPPEEVRRLEAEQKELSRKVEKLLEEWMVVEEELERSIAQGVG